MTNTVGDIMAALAAVFPFDKAAGWDAVGLQLGDPAAAVSSVGVCHEVTDDIVDYVETDPIDLLISYHALLFRPVSSLRPGLDAPGRAFRLIRAGTAVGVIHTAFDVAAGGAADALSDALGLTDALGFGPVWGLDTVKVVTFAPAAAVEAVAAAMHEAGAGRIGTYRACSFRSDGVGAFDAPSAAAPAAGQPGATNREPESRIEMIAAKAAVPGVVAALVAAHPYEEPAYDVIDTSSNAGFVGRVGRLADAMSLASLAARVDDVLGGVVRLAGDGDREVARVAAVPGSGSSLLPAVPPGTHALVTGDVTHHRAREALDRGVAIIDAGHIATERPGIARLLAALRTIRPDTIDLTHLDPSPWRAP